METKTTQTSEEEYQEMAEFLAQYFNNLDPNYDEDDDDENITVEETIKYLKEADEMKKRDNMDK